jgi:hypothetical protein
MVLDPFTALSVASSIAQFVEFGAAIISKSYEIYRSPDGMSVHTGDVEKVSGNLIILCNGFSEYLYNAVDTQEQGLRQTAVACKDIGDELLKAISHFKKEKGNKRHLKWRSFRQALASVMNHDKIEGLKKRLDLYRGQLVLHLAAFVR